MLDFYIVDELYLEYLRSCGFSTIFDTNNPDYKRDKFVFGVVFNIYGIDYYAQVSSLNHKNFGTNKGKEHYLDRDSEGNIVISKFAKKYRRRLFPIHDYTHNNEPIIAYLRLDYMFPVHQKDLKVIEIDDLYTGSPDSEDPQDIADMQYQILTSKERTYCVSKCADIDKKAQALYRAVTRVHNPDDIKQYCLDFLAVEQKYNEWIKQNKY